jgi:hypothetical protein
MKHATTRRLSTCRILRVVQFRVPSGVSPSSRGPGRGPFKAKTRVRIPLGTKPSSLRSVGSTEGQERVDPLDWVEPAQHRNERREESLTDRTMVPKHGALRAPSLARTCHDLPAFWVVAVLQGTSSGRGEWPPSAEDSGAREESRRPRAAARLMHRRRGYSLRATWNRNGRAVRSGRRCPICGVAARVRRTAWMSATTRSAASILSFAMYSQISSRSANASGWKA